MPDDLSAFCQQFFTYHPPREGQSVRYDKIRKSAAEMAKIILENTPECPDQEEAITRLREAVMFANAAIACWE